MINIDTTSHAPHIVLRTNVQLVRAFKKECAVGDARGSQIVQTPNSQAELPVCKTVEFILPFMHPQKPSSD
jgi:hypothetical protein